MQKAALIPGRTLTTTEGEQPRSTVCTLLIIIKHIDKQHFPSHYQVMSTTKKAIHRTAGIFRDILFVLH